MGFAGAGAVSVFCSTLVFAGSFGVADATDTVEVGAAATGTAGAGAGAATTAGAGVGSGAGTDFGAAAGLVRAGVAGDSAHCMKAPATKPAARAKPTMASGRLRLPT